MDIVVTIPKSEYENDDKEVREYQSNKDSIVFWTLAAVPRHLKVGCRVYFVKNNQVERSMRVIEVNTDSSMTCGTTGRTWSGKCQLVMDQMKEETFDKQIKGFQGFRYLDSILK